MLACSRRSSGCTTLSRAAKQTSKQPTEALSTADTTTVAEPGIQQQQQAATSKPKQGNLQQALVQD
jgi:hypothetical protein